MTTCPQDRLGPLRLTKTPKDFKVLWHHPARCKKYQYFLNQPTSLTGAGSFVLLFFGLKDVSSLETLIPEEYHIIKNKGLKGLQCYDDKFTVLLEDDKQKLRVFPSTRQICLLFISIFHELIRQVSVECAERGHLLAKIRERYVALLDHIPRQVKCLHTETLAQKALDRRLTKEIVHFKSCIAKLNIELSAMKEHDENVSKEAEEAKGELAKALEESQRNAKVIVAEYHELYELQRRRLEGQMSQLYDERDLWRKATYSLAVKIIKINKLNLIRRLNISEQTWAKTADHFTVFLTAKDSEDVSHIMELTDYKQRETIGSLRANVVKWHKFYKDKSRSVKEILFSFILHEMDTPKHGQILATKDTKHTGLDSCF
uniref:Axonemal dynein light chain domain containing 1 n=1 Tax=Sinocyclocheilus rhinocerous TaxID=307959 RepID=A0A673J1B5_9TELE